MSTHQVLFLTSDCDAAALWLAGLDRFERTYSTTIASWSALSTSAAARFDLIIVEAEAGTTAGALETCRRLRSRMYTPILVISSLDDEDHGLEVYKTGADDYIAKPISLRLLHAKLKAWQRWIVPAKQSALCNRLQASKKAQ